MIVRRDAHNFIIVIVHEIWCNLNFIYFGTFKAPRTVVQNSIESVELRIKFRNKKRNNDNFRIEIFNTLNSFRPVNRYLSIYVHVSHRRRREVNNRRDKNRVVFFKKNFFRDARSIASSVAYILPTNEFFIGGVLLAAHRRRTVVIFNVPI